MFEWFFKEIASVMTAAVMAVSNVAPIYTDVAETDDTDDLTYQNIELYPNGEGADEVVVLDGFMPEEAEAAAVDVSDEHDGIAAYDITITDGREEYQPGEEHPILVEISDPVIPDSESIELWHISDSGDREQVPDITVEEGKVTFYATGFSVYEIVEPISEVDIPYPVVTPEAESEYGLYKGETIGENGNYTYPVENHFFPGVANRIKNLDDFKAHIGDGVYISTNGNLYAKNVQNNNVRAKNRTGIEAYNAGNNGTVDSRMQNALLNGAAKYYFEPVDPDDEDNIQYYIYTFADDETTKKYVGHSPKNNNSNYNAVYLTNDDNNTAYTDHTVWELDFTTNGCFTFKDIQQYGDMYWYLCQAYKNGTGTVDGLAAWRAANDGNTFNDGAYMNLWLYEPLDEEEADPYALDGKSYGLVHYASNTVGQALLSGTYRGAASLGAAPMTRDASAVTYRSNDGYSIPSWTFEWVSGTSYKLKVIADDGRTEKYLKLDPSALTLVSSDEATAFTVTPNSEGRIQLSADTNYVRYNNSNSFIGGAASQAATFDLVDTSVVSGETLGLDENTYKLISLNGYAMLAIEDGTTKLKRQQVSVVTNSSNENEFISFDEFSDWTFEWVEGNRYVISSTADGSTKYLKLTYGALTLSDTPYVLTVIEGSGANDNELKIYNASDRCMAYNANSYTNQFSESSDRLFAPANTVAAPTSDPLGLDGKTYGVVLHADDTVGYALNTHTTLTYDTDSETYTGSTTMIPSWTFHWAGENRYTLENSNGKFLTSNLKLDDTATEFAVITEDGRLVFYDPSTRKRIADNTSNFTMQATTAANAYAFDLVDINAQKEDLYDLNGKTFGIVKYQVGSSPAYALSSTPSGTNKLAGTEAVVRENPISHDGVNFVTADDINEWTFESIGGDMYYIYTTEGTAKVYLNIDSSSVSASETKTPIQVIPGTGSYEDKIRLVSGTRALRYNSSAFDSAADSATDAKMWMDLVEKNSLTPDDFVVYSAEKVGVGERGEDGKYVVKNGDEVLVYTRIWDEDTESYSFFAINHDGSLVRCYERGNDIMWVGSKINTMLWEFTEYYDAETNEPNFYYELYNDYSGKYLAPQVGSVLADAPVGINLDGRKNDEYYSKIVAWDTRNYSYQAVRADRNSGQAISVLRADAKFEYSDFYFAVIPPKDESTTNSLTEVETIENAEYGITMKMIDLDSRDQMSSFLGNNSGGTTTNTVKDLLSTDIDPVTGYPKTAQPTEGAYSAGGYTYVKGKSLGDLYAGATTVDGLFIKSTYEATGYFEFDSCQNTATLVNNNTDGSTTIGDHFTVYKELASDNNPSTTHQHGQFYPYNGILPGKENLSVNENKYTALNTKLDPNDPREGEPLYLLQGAVNPYNGVELSASFVQTADGMDAWDHDIIFEFTGDDDFWLYVDNELVIDLGGIHSALEGSVNFRTGEVKVNSKNAGGRITTLRELYEENFTARYKEANPDAEEEQVTAAVNEYLNGIFKPNSTVFKDYSNHTMRIFYMERGAGASNLHMRFNLSYVTPGSVTMTKDITDQNMNEISGIDTSLIKYPYQIYYNDKTGWKQLTEATTAEDKFGVYYLNPKRKADFYARYKPTNSNIIYQNVFFLYPGKDVSIVFPEDAIQYFIVECGVNDNIYNPPVYNSLDAAVPDSEIQELIGDSTTGSDETYKQYVIAQDSVKERPKVALTNRVDTSKLRTLTVTKKVYDKDDHEVTDDDAKFSFRLYLSDVGSIKTDEEGNPIMDEDGSVVVSDALKLAYRHEYYVVSPNKKLCRWDPDIQDFAETAYADTEYSSLEEGEKNKVTFESSIYGRIDNIPAGYSVKIPNLMIGTYFMVEERYWDNYSGYDLIGYECVKKPEDGFDEPQASYTVTAAKYGFDGTEVGAHQNYGVIEKFKTDSEMEIKNRKGFGLEAKKVWSDADYSHSHDTVYFAVYVKDGTSETLVPDTVRAITPDNMSVRYFIEDKLDGKTIDNFVIREVKLTGTPVYDTDFVVTGYDSITPVPNNGTIQLNTVTDNGVENFPYYVDYTREPQGDLPANSKYEVVTNTRQGGIAIRLFQWGTQVSGADQVALPNGEFTLKKDGSNVVTAKESYISDTNGLVTVLYTPSEDGTYELAESRSPRSFIGMPQGITFQLGQNEQSSDPLRILTQPSDMIEGSDELKPFKDRWMIIRFPDSTKPNPEIDKYAAVIDIYNKPFTLQVVKESASDNTPLAGAHFELYKMRYDNEGNEIKDYVPVSWDGESELVSGADGVIPHLDEQLAPNLATNHDKQLVPLPYCLVETRAPRKYNRLTEEIELTVNELGEITCDERYMQRREVLGDDNVLRVVFTISIPNTPSSVEYYFDIEKVIMVDQYAHKKANENDEHAGDKEQKFVFLVEKLNGSMDTENQFYVTLNCTNDITDTYAGAPDDYGGKSYDPERKEVTCADGYCYPAAIWNGIQTVKVAEQGTYRVTEIAKWSGTDYEFWEGTNVYIGTDAAQVIKQGTTAVDDSGQPYVVFNVTSSDKVRDDCAKASFTNSETEYAYLSSQAYAENTFKR